MRTETEARPFPECRRPGEHPGRVVNPPPLSARRVPILSHPLWCASVLCAALGVAASGLSWGPCRIDEGVDAAVMVRHLKGACLEEDRDAFPVLADDVLEALRQGRGVDLKGVVLTGDLFFDRLPLMPVEANLIGVPAIAKRIDDERVSAVRVIYGPFMLEDVEVRGVMATNIKTGYVLVRGPVSLRGTVIQRALDFSRMIFLDDADFSGMRIGYEGFFIQTLFAGNADFARTDFGIHSRFHHARFVEKVAFTGATFHGLAEFLEVSFAGDAEFARAHFVQGTGFSGSRFHHTSNFSAARFEREVYFRFTAFEDEANFQRALFRNTADFTEARFGGGTDFRHAVFETPPQISGVELPEPQ